jgi:hypothetical protein
MKKLESGLGEVLTMLEASAVVTSLVSRKMKTRFKVMQEARRQYCELQHRLSTIEERFRRHSFNFFVESAYQQLHEHWAAIGRGRFAAQRRYCR